MQRIRSGLAPDPRKHPDRLRVREHQGKATLFGPGLEYVASIGCGSPFRPGDWARADATCPLQAAALACRAALDRRASLLLC